MLASTILLAAPALADLRVEFREGAPKDRFVVVNDGVCALPAQVVSIDLGPSAGRLIFDTTGAGAGVEVFQPLDVTDGAAFLAVQPSARDGQTRLDLSLKALPAGARVELTTDLDDTVGQRAITVSGSEITGAVLTTASATAQFDASASATLPMPGC
jgi:hypothetical protein